MTGISKHIVLSQENHDYIINRIKKVFPRRNGHRLLSPMLNAILDVVREAETLDHTRNGDGK